MAQVVENLPGKHKTLNSNSSTVIHTHTKSCYLCIEIALLLPFQFGWFFFFLLDCFGEDFSTILNRSDENGHPYLDSDLREKDFGFSSLKLWCQLWAIHRWPLLCWGNFFLFLQCWDFLSWKCEFQQKLFVHY
jgi:hypothetical protein